MDALEGAGYTPAQITALGQNSNGVLDQMKLVLIGAAKVTTDLVFQLADKIDRKIDGWTCVNPVEAKTTDFEPFLQDFLREEDNGHLGGEKMIKRAEEQGVQTGLRHAEAMLRNQEKIPVEWQRYCLVFPEVWQNLGGCCLTFYLYYHNDHWGLYHRWLVNSFDSEFRFVASR